MSYGRAVSYERGNHVQATEPKGAVDLKGAIVSISKRVKLAIEIETGVLIAEKGLEKRVYVFTTVDPGAGICSSQTHVTRLIVSLITSSYVQLNLGSSLSSYTCILRDI